MEESTEGPLSPIASSIQESKSILGDTTTLVGVDLFDLRPTKLRRPGYTFIYCSYGYARSLQRWGQHWHARRQSQPKTDVNWSVRIDDWIDSKIKNKEINKKKYIYRRKMKMKRVSYLFFSEISRSHIPFRNQKRRRSHPLPFAVSIWRCPERDDVAILFFLYFCVPTECSLWYRSRNVITTWHTSAHSPSNQSNGQRTNQPTWQTSIPNQ